MSGHVVDSLSQLWAGHHPVITAISRCPHLTPRYLAAHGTGGRCELFKVHSHIKLQSPTSARHYFWIHCHGPVMNCRTTTQEGGRKNKQNHDENRLSRDFDISWISRSGIPTKKKKNICDARQDDVMCVWVRAHTELPGGWRLFRGPLSCRPGDTSEAKGGDSV